MGFNVVESSSYAGSNDGWRRSSIYGGLWSTYWDRSTKNEASQLNELESKSRRIKSAKREEISGRKEEKIIRES